MLDILFYRFLVLAFSICFLCNINALNTYAQTTKTGNLQNVINSVSQNEQVGKKSTGEKKKNLEEEAKEEIKEEKVDPTQDYRLIAVYIISKEPRALIKSVINPEVGNVEFREGDTLDEEGTVTVSKIILSPTPRVQLLDNDGVAYYLKPYTLSKEIQAPSKSKGGTYGKSLPSSFSHGGTKSKSKKSTSVETTSLPQAAPPPAQVAPPPQETQGTAATGGGQPSETTQATKTQETITQGQDSSTLKPVSPQGGSQAQDTSAKSDTTKQTDSFGVSRPSNPFGQ